MHGVGQYPVMYVSTDFMSSINAPLAIDTIVHLHNIHNHIDLEFFATFTHQ